MTKDLSNETLKCKRKNNFHEPGEITNTCLFFISNNFSISLDTQSRVNNKYLLFSQ